MATRNEWHEELTNQGKTEDEFDHYDQKYLSRFGSFDANINSPEAVEAGNTLKNTPLPTLPTPLPAEEEEREKSRRYYSQREGRMFDNAQLKAVQESEYGREASFATVNKHNEAKAVDYMKERSGFEPLQVQWERLKVAGKGLAEYTFMELVRSGLTPQGSTAIPGRGASPTIEEYEQYREGLDQAVSLVESSETLMNLRASTLPNIARIEELTEQFTSPTSQSFATSVKEKNWSQLGRDVADSLMLELPNFATIIGLSFVHPALGLGYAGITTGASRYAEGVAEGEDPADAVEIATIHMAAEVIFEAGGSVGMVSDMAKRNAKKEFTRTFTKKVVDAVREPGTEMGTQITQNIADGKPWNEGVIEAGTIGGVFGTSMNMVSTVQEKRQIRKIAADLKTKGAKEETIAKWEAAQKEKDPEAIKESVVQINEDLASARKKFTNIMRKNVQKIPVPSEWSPWTLGELTAIGSQNDEQGVEKIVQTAIPEVQNQLRVALLNPTEETTTALNERIKEVATGENPDADVETVEGIPVNDVAPEIIEDEAPVVSEAIEDEAPEQEPNSARAIFDAMPLDEYINYIADQLRLGYPIGDEHRVWLRERVGNDEAMQEAQEKILKLVDAPMASEPTVKKGIELVEIGNHVSLEAEGFNQFLEELENLQHRYLPQNSAPWEKIAAQEYKEREINKPFDEYADDVANRQRIRRRDFMYESLVEYVRDGRVNAVRSFLAGEGLDPKGAFTKNVVEATKMIYHAKRGQDMKENRVDVHTRGAVNEAGVQYGADPLYDVVTQLSDGQFNPITVAKLKQQYNPAFIDQVMLAYNSLPDATFGRPEAVVNAILNERAQVMREPGQAYRTRPAVNSGIKVSNLGKGMTQANTVTSINHMKKNLDYDDAKNDGNVDCAVDLVLKFKDRFNYAEMEANGVEIIVPLDTLESGSKNAIPYAMAAVIGDIAGLPTSVLAVTGKSKGLTNATFFDRMASDHIYFAENKVAGKRVMLVDDTFTSGKTILAAVEAIERAGGTVVMVQAMAASQTGKQLIPTAEQVKSVLSTIGMTNEQFFDKYGFFPEDLTGAQIKRLVVLNNNKDKSKYLREFFGKLAENAGRGNQASRIPQSAEVREGDVTYELQNEDSGSLTGTDRPDPSNTASEEARGQISHLKTATFPTVQKIVTIRQAQDWLENAGYPRISEPGKTAQMIEELLQDPAFTSLSIFDRIRVAAQVERPVRSRDYSPNSKPKANRKLGAVSVRAGTSEKVEGSGIVAADTVAGCDHYCFECYALKGAQQTRISHQHPILRDLAGTIRAGELLRIGEVGDPSKNWAHTHEQVQKLIARSQDAGNEVDFDNVFYITKLLNLNGFNPETARNLQVSLDPFYPAHMSRAFQNILRIKSAYPEVNIAVRVRSIATFDTELQESQQKAIDFAKDYSLPVLETRMRFVRKSSFDILSLDKSKYKREGNQWKLKGNQFQNEQEQKFVCDKNEGGCVTCKGCSLTMRELRPSSVENQVLANPYSNVEIGTEVEFDPTGGSKVFEPGVEYQTSPLGFFSPLKRAVEEMDFKKIPPAQLMARIKKLPKQEEMNDIGLYDWLDLQDGKVTKADVLDFIDDGGVQLEETTYGGELSLQDSHFLEINELAHALTAETAAEQKYRANLIDRIVFPMSEGELNVELIKEHTKIADEAFGENWWSENETVAQIGIRLTRMLREYSMTSGELKTAKNSVRHEAYQTTGESSNYREYTLSIPVVGLNAYQLPSEHYPTPNTIVHFRTNDRTIDGNRVLHIEEIQSDWMQDLRKWNTEVDPGAFKKSGTVEMLAMKRIMKMAVDGGYDAIAWTSGKTQTIRWSSALRGQVESVEWFPAEFQHNQARIDELIHRAEAQREVIESLKKTDTIRTARDYEAEGGEAAYNAKSTELSLEIIRLQVKSKGVGTEAIKKLNAERAILWDINARHITRQNNIRTAEDELYKYNLQMSRVRNRVSEQPSLRIVRKNGRSDLVIEYNPTTGIITKANEHGNELVGQPLSDLVGDKITAQIMGKESGKVEGDDIMLGSKGFEDIYDRMLVKGTQAYIKKFGAKVGRGTIDGDIQVHLVKIPEKMRTEVKTKGVALYEPAKKYLAGKNLPQTEEAIGQVQTEMELLSDPAGSKPFPGVPPSKLTPEERRDLNAKVFEIIRSSEPKSKADRDLIEQAFAEGIPVSSVISELYTNPGTFWPVAGTKLATYADVHAAAILMRSPYQESFKILFVDDAGNVVEARIASIGTINSSSVDTRMTFGNPPAGATGIILSHNHPSGYANPSDEDIKVTQDLIAAGKMMSLPIIDHVITNGQSIYSMRAMRKMGFGGDTAYGQNVDELTFAEQTAIRKEIGANPLAAWEVMRRDTLKPSFMPPMAYNVVSVLRQSETKDVGHIIILNMQGNVVSMIRFDARSLDDASRIKLANKLTKEIVGDANGVSVVMDLPKVDGALGELDQFAFVRRLRNQLYEVNIPLMDALITSDTSFVSLREAKMVDFSPPQNTAAPGQVQEPALPAHLQRIQVKSERMAQNFFTDIGIDQLDGLSDQDQDQVMRYAAYKSGYDTLIDEVEFGSLSPIAQNFLDENGGWMNWVRDNAEALTGIRETLGLNFEALAGYVLPMRHMISDDFSGTTMADMVEHSRGVTMNRTGSYGGVVKNVRRQVEITIRDSSTLIAIAEELGAYIEQVEGNEDLIAVALEKRLNEDALTPKEEKALEILDEAREVQDKAVSVGMDEQAKLSDEHFEDIRVLLKDGGGGSIPDVRDLVPERAAILKKLADKVGTNWAYLIDPPFMTQRMDGLNGEKSEDGRIYGAHSYLLDDVYSMVADIKATGNARDVEIADLFQPFINQQEKEQLNEDLHRIIMGKGSRLLPRMSVDSVMVNFGVDQRTAIVVKELATQLVNAKVKIARGKDIRSKVSELSSERRAAFYALERKIQEGLASKEEIETYIEYSKNASGEKSKSAILRNAARAVFEKAALDEHNFIGYFGSVMAQADRGDAIPQMASRIDAFADYLQNHGKEAEAKWWRNYSDRNLRNKPFELENDILAGISEVVSIVKGAKPDENGNYAPADIVAGRNPAQIHRLMLESANTISRARINSYLTGNLGWSLLTQWTSLAMTVKSTGYTRTVDALKKTISKDNQSDESLVVAIKAASHGHGVEALAAVADMEEAGLSVTKRERFRQWANKLLAEPIESAVTRASYLAGYQYADEVLKANDRDKRVHGDFTAAQTQSMYDSLTRNPALNSALFRLWKPMQSYKFTAFGQLLDSVGVVGLTKPKAQRVAEFTRWVITQRLISAILSLAFGDDILKAIFDPIINKGSAGSNLPAIGGGVDRQLSAVLPWKENKDWQGQEAFPRFLEQSFRLGGLILTGNEHALREAALYSLDYVTPLAGIPGSVPAKNSIRMLSAGFNTGRFEGITGRRYAEFNGMYNPARWAGGIMFGIKAVDGE